MSELTRLTVRELRNGYIRKDFSPVEVLRAVHDRIEETGDFNTVISLAVERASEQAEHATQSFMADGGPPGALLGIPVLVKDAVDVEGMRTSWGSGIPDRPIARTDATVIARARRAGAVIVGKSHMYEFAWGIGSDNPHFGTCLNPWDRTRTTGGSSSGSAAAVALGQVPLALGTDTAGSIRIPASFCGIAGFKPSAGSIDQAGVFPLAPSLDQVGPMARTPEDLALALEVISGAATTEAPRDYGSRMRGLRVGVWPGMVEIPPAVAVRDAIRHATAAIEDLGGAVDEVEAPAGDEVLDAFSTLQMVEAANVHHGTGLFPRYRASYSDVLVERLERGRRVGIDRYLDAAAVRREVMVRYFELFNDHDLVLAPVSPVGPPRLGEEDAMQVGAAHGMREVVLGYTVPQALAGVPSCTVAAGFDSDRMPIGLQLMGPVGSDRRVLAAAGALAPHLAESWGNWLDERTAMERMRGGESK